MKIFGLLLVIVSFFLFGKERVFMRSKAKEFVKIEIQESIKNSAFSVLQEKCNTCHATKKRTDIFTLQNMDSFGSEIHRQVFIKKKMPKGRKVKLTDEERGLLKKWLLTIPEVRSVTE